MLTPLSRLKDALGANARAPMTSVLAGDVQDVAGELDPKNANVKKLLGMVGSAERPGQPVRVPADALRDVVEQAMRPPAEIVPEVPQ